MKCAYVSVLLLVLFGFIHSWPMKNRCPSVTLKNGRVRIKAKGRILRFDCFEGFTLIGNRYSTCIRGLWDTPVPVCVSTQCATLETYPHPLMVAMKMNGAVQMFFCPYGYTLIGSAEIYCDGHRWNGSIPYCRDTKEPAPTSCDFERTDLCWWEQDPQHDFDWRRHNFGTPSSHIGTGPTHDHTLGLGNDGHYLYIEASGQLVNDTARITSPLYIASQAESACFSFWYHMYGATMGTLNIYFKQEMNSTKRLMFSRSEDQGNQWLHGFFYLPKTNANFQIVIEGVRGATYVSDIAIDDVALLSGEECVTAKNEITSVTAGDDDQVELVNALQTCRDRCVYTEPQLTELSTTTISSGPESCRCTLDCAERSLCCPDYAYYCVLAYTTEEVSTEIPKISESIFVNNKSVTSENIPVPTRNTLTGFPINPKDNIDPGTAKWLPNTTRRPVWNTVTAQKSIWNTVTSMMTTRRPIWTTTLPPITTRKPILKTTLASIKRTTTIRAPPRTTKFVPQTQRIETKETPFAAVFLSTKYAILDQPEMHVVTENPEKVKNDGGVETLLIIAITTIVVVLSLALIIANIIMKRRKSYKRGASSSALSEDSDVRYLTSDEILDFNLARPANDNEDM